MVVILSGKKLSKSSAVKDVVVVDVDLVNGLSLGLLDVVPSNVVSHAANGHGRLRRSRREMFDANATVDSGTSECRMPGRTSMRLRCAAEAEISNASRHQVLEGTRTGRQQSTESLAPGGHTTLTGLLSGGDLVLCLWSPPVLFNRLSIPVAAFSPCQAARPVQCLIVPRESNYVCCLILSGSRCIFGPHTAHLPKLTSLFTTWADLSGHSLSLLVIVPHPFLLYGLCSPPHPQYLVLSLVNKPVTLILRLSPPSQIPDSQGCRLMF
ncbi:hypothetical protein DPX16_4986 [Anabarilius grahami]|uniref:Uncharacterized protein n=1 Tax=Anabarilius grahami TaxID=495550 RepID=A0A3N0YDW9_ANAGA|nr:hypothetical protein DPX16_4986 [Anabarilius grahami]